MKLNNINWHGSNTINFIKSIIENHGIDNHYLPLLKYSFNDNNCLMSCSFIDDFKQEQPDLQKFIVDLFAKALDNNLLFPSRGDDNIVKNVKGTMFMNFETMHLGEYVCILDVLTIKY